MVQSKKKDKTRLKTWPLFSFRKYISNNKLVRTVLFDEWLNGCGSLGFTGY